MSKPQKTYSIDPANHERVTEMAVKTRRSKSAVVNLAIEHYWKNFESLAHQHG